MAAHTGGREQVPARQALVSKRSRIDSKRTVMFILSLSPRLLEAALLQKTVWLLRHELTSGHTLLLCDLCLRLVTVEPCRHLHDGQLCLQALFPGAL